MARTVKPFTQIVDGITATAETLAAIIGNKDETIGSLADAAAFAAEQADQRTRQLKDVTPRGDSIDVFVAVSGELVLRATKLMPNGMTDVQVHYLEPASAYALADDLEYAADELA